MENIQTSIRVHAVDSFAFFTGHVLGLSTIETVVLLSAQNAVESAAKRTLVLTAKPSLLIAALSSWLRFRGGYEVECICADLPRVEPETLIWLGLDDVEKVHGLIRLTARENGVLVETAGVV